ncbi:DNA repair protein rad18 [Westerdykella ornata]|uniref:Postreplication repair E3 ubiquitin-protein ligase RAD18 n=1 Tax=Westerdykella ornata TaxID=318751 RepID=A0A6A6JA33_WESOR|nr:DNA repair protein rad18 [Westerdykella ornata]KAF2273033.1 DNA repair protein rad18 [Westerdykella ornata]
MEALPDSTDWLRTSLPLFAPLESSLRCEVCKEFYSNPVITTCSHTFCSLCVRRAISVDGKCPACKAACQADRLVPNFALREVVGRWVEAREAALELAMEGVGKGKVEGVEADISNAGMKKRKAGDMEVAGESGEEEGRRTRSRMTRSSSQRGKGVMDEPFEIKDSEDEGDAEFMPDGMVACPICSKHMKEEQVWGHLNNGSCPGEQQNPTGARSTRSRSQNHTFLAPSGRSSREVPAPARLPGINYSMMKEKDLKKKLQDLGIPAWGKKDLLIRRHTEWLHLWNSNCDASEDNRKSKRDLLRELDVWERTRGGRASATEPIVMRKDFDGKGHAEAHKSQFDELIAAARAKRGVPKAKEDNGDATTATPGEEPQHEAQQDAEDMPQPTEETETGVSTIRAQVAATDLEDAVQSPYIPEATPRETLVPTGGTADSDERGIQTPFGSPSKKLPMFALPEEPAVDVEHSASIP